MKSDEDFLARPAWQAIVNEMAKESQESLAGQRIAQYEIEGLLGVGGMGEVFLANDTPVVSPDGRTIIFCSTTDGQHIWRMERDGSQRRQLTFGEREVEPRCSPDGTWVVYVSWSKSRQATLWRAPLAGGEAVRLTGPTTANPSPAISPDGRWVAYYYRAPHEIQRKRIVLIPLSGGPPVRQLDVPHSAYLLQWSPDGRSLDYTDTIEEVGNLWRLPLDGGPARQITDFKTDVISRFAWSRDGAQLAVSRLIRNWDVVLLRDFQ